MTGFDAFYQEMDSKELLDRHGKDLVADARNALAATPAARFAGVIAVPDSREAASLREDLAKLTRQPVPAGLFVTLVAREVIEPLLSANVSASVWREEDWQPQQVLPVLVVTRDGFRFDFFRFDAAAGAGAPSDSL